MKISVKAFALADSRGRPPAADAPKMGKASGSGVWRSLKHALAAFFKKPRRFERTWRRYENRSVAGSIEGRWRGEWISTENGHRGALRCIITCEKPGTYAAIFHATYARVLKVCYRVILRGCETYQSVALQGEADLGWFAGGRYHYSGTATPSQFQCRYECKYDKGNFSLHR
jgi:hypothetical protein